jgi:hypothetical protein
MCKCGCDKFFLITEKLYEGCLNEKGTMECEPDSEYVTEIKCSGCGRHYQIKDFAQVDY